VKRISRVIFGIAALVAVSASLSACDGSPFAAQVNGQVINETALMTELSQWARAPGYVSEFNDSNSQANGGTGVTVAGASVGHTYNSTWVANQLAGMIEGLIVHQHLVATTGLPNQAFLNAARSVSEIAESSFWYQLTPEFRDVLVERLAEQAALTPVTESQATLKQVYDQYLSYFYSQVCVLEAFGTLSEMQALSAGGTIDGTPVCYDQATMEQQPQDFQKAVLGLAVGKRSQPIKTETAYQVVQVTSRVVQPFGTEVQKVISTVVSEASGAGVAPAITNLVNTAKVRVNPTYGSWHNSQVVPPTPPPQPSSQ
jgi:hypothetical protein